jgi:hypothetical protein
MSATILVSINGTLVSTQNIFVYGTPAGWLSTPAVSRTITPLGGRIRSYRSTLSAFAPRSFDIPFRIAASSLATRLSNSDWIKAFISQKITLKVDDGSWTRELLCDVMNVQLTPYGRWDTAVCDGLLQLVAVDPTWRATSDTTVSSIGSTPITLSLGGIASELWTLDVTGFTSNLTITFGGTVTTVVVYTGSMAAGHTLHLNSDLATCLDNAANVIAGLAGGFPPLDPNNGTVTIALTASAGTPSGTLVYRKRYP